jgi:hypothetical protein
LKRVLKDEFGYPIGFDPSKFYQEPERLFPLPPSLYNTKPGLYYISTWGRIYNSETCTYVPRNLISSKNQYIGICIKDINGKELYFPMHQAVIKTFIIPKILIPGQTLVPNHKDGIKWHNEPYNLEWVTESENTRHADNNNLIERPFGEDNGQAALTDEQYNRICQLTQEGYKAHEINKIMNVGFDITNIAQKIRNGKSEILISQNYDFSNIPKNDYRKFTEDQVKYICQSFQDNPQLSFKEILYNMGYDLNQMDHKSGKKLRDTLSTIKRRVSYIEISKNYKF